MMNSELTPDICRQIAKDKNISNETISSHGFELLHYILCKHVYASELFGSTYKVDTFRKMDAAKKTRDGLVCGPYFHVSAHYFKRREAISFNRGGYIGFCGWASSGNALPVLLAFVEWCNRIDEARHLYEAES